MEIIIKSLMGPLGEPNHNGRIYNPEVIQKAIESWNEFLEKKGEQKPYGQRQECADCQFNYAGECKGSCAMKRGEQKPAWSEEDEERLSIAIRCCEAAGRNAIGNWLKSIRPQNHWKPSEEQMKTLNEVINYCANGKEAYLNDYIYNRLIDLRDELNKL